MSGLYNNNPNYFAAHCAGLQHHIQIASSTLSKMVYGYGDPNKMKDKRQSKQKWKHGCKSQDNGGERFASRHVTSTQLPLMFNKNSDELAENKNGMCVYDGEGICISLAGSSAPTPKSGTAVAALKLYADWEPWKRAPLWHQLWLHLCTDWAPWMLAPLRYQVLLYRSSVQTGGHGC